MMWLALGVFLVSVLVGVGAASAQPNVKGSEKARVQSVPGELLVKLRAGTGPQAAASAHAAVGARVVRSFGFIGWQHVKLPPGVSADAAMAKYRQMPQVAAVEPNFIYHALISPNDPRYPELWGMSRIGAPTAWDAARGSASVVVAVIDTGVKYNHEDLAANMWRNPGEVAGNGLDDDANGYVDDVYGIDAANVDADPMDDHDHGSHCSGTIGGVGDNGIGVAGVNWTVRIMALKFLDAGGSGALSAAVTCFQYVTMMKQRGVAVRVTNNSWGGGGYSQALKDAIDAAGSQDILNCVAAGNEGSNIDVTPSYPAAYDSPSILAVAASDSADNAAWFSNYGSTRVDLAAPGVGIWSTVRSGYASFDGTSMATPHVAGAAALLASRWSGTALSLKSILMNSVDVLPQWQGKVVTNGRLNLARAMSTLATLGIGGTVTLNGSGLGGVTIQITGPASRSTTTSSDGAYAFFDLPAGTYTVTPSKTNHLFTPASRQATTPATGVDFAATRLHVTVASPNGGELWRIGSAKPITWASAGVSGNVRIELSRNGGGSWETLFASTANDGSESWTVAGAPTPQARIRITSVNEPALTDTSDGLFTLNQLYRITGTVTQGGSGFGGVQVRAVSAPFNVSRSSAPAVAIPDLGAVEDALQVPESGTVVAVTVGVNISHTWVADLQVTLIAPDGTQVVLHDHTGGSSDNIVTSYPDVTAPAQSLSALQGKPINGTWRLQVKDNAGLDSGTLNSWTLTLRAEVSAAVNTGTDGTYALNDLPAAAYTVTPTKAPAVFEPASRPVTLGPDQAGVDFSGVIPGITVVSPNGGEVWLVGSVHEIRWTGLGVSGNVKIEVSPDGGATWQTLLASTDNDGVETWTAAGSDTTRARVRVTSIDNSAFSDTSNANFTLVRASGLKFVGQPSNAVAGALIQPDVRVALVDGAGAVVPGVTGRVTIAIGTNPAGGKLSGATSAAMVAGVATFANLSIDRSGAPLGYTLVASCPGLPSVTSARFVVSPGAAARLGFLMRPLNTYAGVAFPRDVKVAVQDSFGNTVTGATGSVSVALGNNPGGGTLSGATTANVVSGVAIFPGLSIEKAGSGYTMVASSTGLQGVTSPTFLILPGPAAQLSFLIQPANTTGGTPISPAVKVAVTDRFGNRVSTHHTVAMALGTNPAGGRLSGVISATTSGGVATFTNLKVDKAGVGYALAASAGSVQAAQSQPFNVGVGTARNLAFTVQPSSSTGGSTIAPAVKVAVTDAGGNVVPGATNQITVGILMNPAGGTLSGTRLAAASGGVATFANLSINRAGSGYTLRAWVSGLVTATSAPFDVAVGPAAVLSFRVQPVNTAAGSPITPSVQVAALDAGGNVVAGASGSVAMAFGSNPTRATLQGTTTVALSNGVATFAGLSVDKASEPWTCSLKASAAGLAGSTSARFIVTTASAGSASAAGADLLVKAGDEPDDAYAGGSLYQSVPDGEQVVGRIAPAGTAAAYQVLVRNASTARRDLRLGLVESAADAGWHARYTLGGTDVTDLLRRGALVLTGVAAGETRLLTVEVLPDAGVPAEAEASVVVRVFGGSAAASDAVGMVTRAVR